MQGRNHVALALAAPLALAMVTGATDILPGSVVGWGSLILGSLAPDLDGEGSICYLGNFLPRHITPKPLVRILNWIGRTISSFIRAVFGHRTALHWPSWGVIMIAVSLTMRLDWLFWFGLGYILHIFGDSLTKSGVPLFGPLSSKDISFTPMVTGKFTESAFGVLLWLFVAWRIIDLLPYDSWLWHVYNQFSIGWIG